MSEPPGRFRLAGTPEYGVVLFPEAAVHLQGELAHLGRRRRADGRLAAVGQIVGDVPHDRQRDRRHAVVAGRRGRVAGQRIPVVDLHLLFVLAQFLYFGVVGDQVPDAFLESSRYPVHAAHRLKHGVGPFEGGYGAERVAESRLEQLLQGHRFGRLSGFQRAGEIHRPTPLGRPLVGEVVRIEEALGHEVFDELLLVVAGQFSVERTLVGQLCQEFGGIAPHVHHHFTAPDPAPGQRSLRCSRTADKSTRSS